MKITGIRKNEAKPSRLDLYFYTAWRRVEVENQQLYSDEDDADDDDDDIDEEEGEDDEEEEDDDDDDDDEEEDMKDSNGEDQK